LIHIPRVLE